MLNKRSEDQIGLNNHHAQMIDCSNLININPNAIFSTTINQQPQQQQSMLHQPKYATLNNVTDQTNSANNDYLVNFNSQINRNTDDLINLVSKNNLNTNLQPVVKTSEINYDGGNLSSTNILMGVKDELQTVPVYSNNLNNALNHPVNANNNKSTKGKRKASNNSNVVVKNVNIVNGSSNCNVGNGKSMLKVNESLVSQANGVSSRRDTDNSTSSSTNLDSYSPINLDEQEQIKLEKKRERNREAARKCRTRKLEKIATLEEQVKTLTETNSAERARTETLRDEINRLRQKLEMHQKMHNCDLKINF